MVVIALLLLVVVVAVVVFVVVTGASGTVTLEWDQLNMFFEPSPLVLFLLGAATLLLAVVAIAMLRSGSRRSMAKRRELKRLRRLEGEHGTPVAPGTATATRGDQPDGDGRHAAPGTTTTAVHPGEQQKGTLERPSARLRRLHRT